MSASDMFELVDYATGEWGAAADYDGQPVRDGTSQVFVHHPGFNIRDAADGGNVNSEKAQLRSIEKVAMGGPWWGIQYDVIVGQSGNIYAGRGLARSGATSGDVDDDGTHNNTEGEAILVLASPNTPMTEACRNSLERLLDASGVGLDNIYGHKEAKGTATSCPGDDRMKFLEAYRNGTLHDDETETTPDPEPEPDNSHWTEDVMSNLKMLRKGDRDLQVTKVQALLNATRQHSLKEDGIFGPLTERAVYEYQTDRNLAVDGIVGPKTWGSLLTKR